MKSIYLHVGNFKTGTSAIQRFCSDNRQRLLDCGIDYLETARPASDRTNHSLLPLSLIEKYGHFVPEWYEAEGDFDTTSQALLTEIENSPCDKILISSEELYRLACFSQDFAQDAMRELGSLFTGYKVKVLMYVREPQAFIKSWYNQVNKSTLPRRRFIDFFYFTNDAVLLPQANANFWRECFGHDCLVLEHYSRRGSSHIQRFMALIGADIATEISKTAMTVNSGRAESTLEEDRVNKVIASCTAQEKEKYLRSHVFESSANFIRLQKKIEHVNSSFATFCRVENLELEIAPMSLSDLLVHEEKINRKDVIFSNPFKLAMIWALNPWITNLLRKIRKVRG